MDFPIDRTVLLTVTEYNELAAAARLSAMNEHHLRIAEKALIEKDKEIAKLRADASYRRALVQTLAEKDTCISKQTEQIKGMEQQIIDLDRRIATMKQTLLMLDEDRKTAYNAGKFDAQAAAFNASPLHSAMQKTIRDKDVRIAELENQLAAANQANRDQNRAKTTATIEVERLRASLHRKEQRIIELVEEHREADKQLTVANETANRCREVNDALQRRLAQAVTAQSPNPALQSKINKQSREITRLHAKVKELESRSTEKVQTVLGTLNVEPSTIVQMANDLAVRLNQQSRPKFVVTGNGKYPVDATTITALLEENSNLKALVTRFRNALRDIPQF